MARSSSSSIGVWAARLLIARLLSLVFAPLQLWKEPSVQLKSVDRFKFRNCKWDQFLCGGVRSQLGIQLSVKFRAVMI